MATAPADEHKRQGWDEPGLATTTPWHVCGLSGVEGRSWAGLGLTKPYYLLANK